MSREIFPIDVEQVPDEETLSAVAPRPLIEFLKVGIRWSPLPKDLSELPKEEISARLLDESAARALGLTPPDNNSDSRQIFVQQYQRYQEVYFNDEAVLVGVGFRCVLSIEIFSSNADLGSLARIAASAELGYLRASAGFQVIGLTSKAIVNAIPRAENLSVETYTKIAGAFKQIRSLIYAPDTVVSPQVMAISRTAEADQGTNVGERDSAVAERLGKLTVEFGDSMTERDVARASSAISKAILKVKGKLPQFAEPSEAE